MTMIIAVALASGGLGIIIGLIFGRAMKRAEYFRAWDRRFEAELLKQANNNKALWGM